MAVKLVRICVYTGCANKVDPYNLLLKTHQQLKINVQYFAGLLHVYINIYGPSYNIYLPSYI